MTAVRQADYLWLDGATPTQRLRSKTRIVALPEDEPVTLEAFPTWPFDGSPTYRVAGHGPIKCGPVPVLAAPRGAVLGGGEPTKPAHGAVTPMARKGGWRKRHEGLVARARKGDVDVVFLGDSITHDWEGRGQARLFPFRRPSGTLPSRQRAEQGRAAGRAVS